jgi:hypothetical protein
MKKQILLLGIFGMFLLASCSQQDATNDSTPQLTWAANPILDGVSVTTIDTLTVGDTLLLPMTFSGVYNPLTSIQITNDTAYSAISFPYASSLGSSVLNNGQTNVSKGYFYFVGLNIYMVNLAVEYIPKQATTGTKLSFVVSSTSQYSPLSGSFTFIAKAKKK